MNLYFNRETVDTQSMVGLCSFFQRVFRRSPYFHTRPYGQMATLSRTTLGAGYPNTGPVMESERQEPRVNRSCAQKPKWRAVPHIYTLFCGLGLWLVD